jgi:hypothetical protein
MNLQNAKFLLNEYRNQNYNSSFRDESELAQAIDVVLPTLNNLLIRNNPSKPKVNRSEIFTQYNCSVCNCRLDIPQLIIVEYCPKCGQKIDWGDE